jgi:hypothetical protein
MGLWDESLSVQARQERYIRFVECDFGVAPEAEWVRMRQQLLEFEDKLACR